MANRTPTQREELRMHRPDNSNSWTYSSSPMPPTRLRLLKGPERPFDNNVMDSSGYASTRILNGYSVRTEGYSQITHVSSSQIKVKRYA